jgi:hypothetical protein
MAEVAPTVSTYPGSAMSMGSTASSAADAVARAAKGAAERSNTRSRRKADAIAVARVTEAPPPTRTA